MVKHNLINLFPVVSFSKLNLFINSVYFFFQFLNCDFFKIYILLDVFVSCYVIFIFAYKLFLLKFK